jgi:hypothetical protein
MNLDNAFRIQEEIKEASADKPDTPETWEDF